MESFLELLESRRSIRQFTDEKIEQDDVEYILECVLRSPSSRSLNPWQFVVVDDKQLLSELSRCKPHGAAFIKDAPLAIVICADPEKCDVWIEDTSIAATLAHLAAADIGLGSCWVQVRLRENEDGGSAEEYVKEKLSLVDGLRVEAIVAVGHPKVEKEGHPRSSLLFDRISYNLED